MSERKEFDYLIVGAGSAGCVLAAPLSQDPTVRLALLEEAGQDDAPQIGMPPSFLSYSRPSTTREFDKEQVLLHGYRTVCCHARAIDTKPRGSDEPSAVAN
jgi:choline dehydrogenase-like flavoprotein